MIRKGTIGDAEILSKVEATCFPPNEAATLWLSLDHTRAWL